MGTIEDKKMIAVFANYPTQYTAGRITDSLASKLYETWNELMPVVHKCLKVCHENMLNEWENSFADKFLTLDIEPMFKEVVDFINFYNKNKTDLDNCFLFDFNQAEINFHNEIHGKLFNLYSFNYDDQSGGCYLNKEDCKIEIYITASWVFDLSDDNETIGFEISYRDEFFDKVRESIYIPFAEPTTPKEFEEYKLFYLELLEKYSSKDLVD